MDISFLDVLFTVFSLIILIIPGYLLVKTKLLGQSAGNALSTVVLYVCQPALAFIGFQKTNYNSNIAINMLIVAGLAIFLHLVMFGIVWLVTIRAGKTPKVNVMKFASMFGNCGYMGLPFLKSLFEGQGEAVYGEILIYGAIVIAVFNLFCWTLGVYMVSGDKKEVSVKKILLNPTIIAVVLGFLSFVIFQKPIADVVVAGNFFDRLFESLMKGLNFLADTVTPLSMIVIGIRLANVKFTRLFTEKTTYVVSFTKLVVMSVITILSVAFLSISIEVKNVLFFLLSMPCAANTALFAIRYGSDESVGSIYVLFSTIASILTIPLMYMLFNWVIGLV